MSRLVVKVGGAVAARSAEAVLRLAANHQVCVVHGAGPQISSEMERAGIPVEFVGGRRVTTAAGLEIVRSSLAAVNATLCDAIGEQALALLGDEVGLLARRIPELGLVGEVAVRDLPAVDRALVAGRIPVIAPLGVDADGGLLNVNADDAAAAVAIAARADELLFLTDVEGFMVDGEVVDSLDVPTAETLYSGGTLDPTILPKLGAAIAAARTGVPAFIGRTEVIASPAA
jgi:acetylglutamate kinase